MQNVDAATLKKWMENGDAILIDVREPSEHEAQKIPGSILIPLGQLNAASLPFVGNKKLVFHCGSGGRSSRAAEKILAENPNLDVYNLEGGIKAWLKMGEVPTESKWLTIDRQVEITLGLLIVLLSWAGTLFGSFFFFLIGLIGLGMLVSALTDFCVVKQLLEKAPWNVHAPKE